MPTLYISGITDLNDKLDGTIFDMNSALNDALRRPMAEAKLLAFYKEHCKKDDHNAGHVPQAQMELFRKQYFIEARRNDVGDCRHLKSYDVVEVLYYQRNADSVEYR